MSENKTKTYVERFAELEEVVASFGHAFSDVGSSLNYINNNTALLTADVNALNAKVDSLSATLLAMMQLIDEKKRATTENVAKRMSENNANELKKRVEAMESTGEISKVDSVDGDSCLVTFKNKEDVLFGYQLVKDIPSNEVKEQMSGKKSGDEIKLSETLSVEILNVYKKKTSFEAINEKR